jgi:hypothetical protein
MKIEARGHPWYPGKGGPLHLPDQLGDVPFVSGLGKTHHRQGTKSLAPPL